MKRFFLVHLFDDYSGSPRVLASLSAVLSKYNVWHESIIGRGSSGFISELNIGSNVFFYHRSENKFFTLFFYLVSQFSLFCNVLFLCLKHRHDDKVFIINTLLPFGAALAAKLCNAKVYYYSHEISLRPQFLFDFLKAILNFTAHKVIFVSNYLQSQLAIDTKISQNVIYNPLPPHFYNTVLHDIELEDKWNNKIIMMACSLKEYKGINDFIELANNFLYLESYKFLLVLNETNKNADLFYSKLKTPKNFSYSCRPCNLLELYKSSFLVINLSHPDTWIETFGLTLLEGMSQYNPIISPEIGGPTEFTTDNVNGFQISHKNLHLIKDVICKLGNNYSLWRDFSLTAKETSRNFSFDYYEYSIKEFLIKDVL